MMPSSPSSEPTSRTSGPGSTRPTPRPIARLHPQLDGHPRDGTDWHDLGLLALGGGTGLLVGLMLGLMARIDQLAWAWRLMR